MRNSLRTSTSWNGAGPLPDFPPRASGSTPPISLRALRGPRELAHANRLAKRALRTRLSRNLVAPRGIEPRSGVGRGPESKSYFLMLRLERLMIRGFRADYVLAACVALLLPACTSELPTRDTIASTGGSGAVARVKGLRPRASWVLPEARSQNLLYVSGNSGYVYIFSFPKGKLVGTLTGFQEVAGVCADAAGNV